MIKKFKIEVGPRGGQYYVDQNGEKHYVKKTNRKYVEREVEDKNVEVEFEMDPELDAALNPEEVIVPPTAEDTAGSDFDVDKKKVSTTKRYTASFVVRDPSTNEMIDDFKEWCDADSEDEAMAEFKSRYPKIKDITIINVEDI